MRSFLLIAALAACSHAASSTLPRGSWQGHDVLARVPADTPYLFALLEPPSDAVRKKMFGRFDQQVIAAIAEAQAISPDARRDLAPTRRAMLNVLDQMRGGDPTRWWENLGFKDDGRWIVYGLGIWPVIHVEVGNAAKLRSIVSDAVKTLNMPVIQEKRLGTTPYWTATKDGVTAVLSITATDAVLAVMPAATLDQTLPIAIGEQAPGKNLRDAGEVEQLMARHHALPAVIGYTDQHRIVDALERKDMFATTSVFTAPACHADYERIADAVPRLWLGYSKLDAQAFQGTLAMEVAPDAANELAALHTTMPAPPDPAHALFSFVAAADVDAGAAMVRGWLQALVDRPFQCEQLAATRLVFGHALEAMQSMIPPELHGLHGGELVIADATDHPPGGRGYLLVSGDQVATAIKQRIDKLGIPGLKIALDGEPRELPVGLAGVPWLLSGHLAMRASRAAVAINGNSKADVAAALAQPNANRSPLAVLTWDLARFATQVPSLWKEEGFRNLDQIATMILTLDVRDGAVVFDVGGTWSK